MMIPADLTLPQRWFSDQFTDARQRFLQQIDGLREQQRYAIRSQCFSHPALGPAAEPLATDVVWIGPADAQRVIVLGSATHGAEGYAGSAIQTATLHGFAQQQLSLAPDCALLLIHALNPWGMAWQRRCDEQGIDVNRNFVDFNQPLPQPAAYELVHACLTQPDERLRQQALTALRQQLGDQGFDEAVFGGQYRDPAAPFYGGTAASFSRTVTEQVMQQFALQGRDLVVIDLHTGLGPWGYGELICDHPVDSAQEAFAVQLFGAAVAMPARGTSFSAVKAGLLDYAWHRIMSPNSCFLTLEFGSYDTATLLKTVVDEHLIWAGSASMQQKYMQGRALMQRHFCPDDVYWRQAVLFKGWQVLHRLCAMGQEV